MLRVLHAGNYYFTTSHLLSSRECLPREENYKIPCRPCNLLRIRMTSLHAVKLVVNSLVNLQLHQPTMVYGTGRMWCSFWRTAEVCHLRFIRISVSTQRTIRPTFREPARICGFLWGWNQQRSGVPRP